MCSEQEALNSPPGWPCLQQGQPRNNSAFAALHERHLLPCMSMHWRIKQETDILDSLMHVYCTLVSCSNRFLSVPHHLRSQPSHGHPPGLCRICRLQSGPLHLCTPQTAHEFPTLLQPSPTIKTITKITLQQPKHKPQGIHAGRLQPHSHGLQQIAP